VGGNNKSLSAINVDLVVIDDDEFNTCVGHKLDVALGPRKASTMAALVLGPNTLPDYVQMSRLLASAVGQGMMHFTQAVTPQAAVGASLPGQITTLNTGEGFDRDQIAKLKDACGVSMAKEIPNIWYIIQRKLLTHTVPILPNPLTRDAAHNILRETNQFTYQLNSSRNSLC
jgi:hypothetical protein